MSRYDFGLLFGIDHGDKPKVALAESLARACLRCVQGTDQLPG
ncbi:hypothetical protein [Mycobacterium sp.]|nr:hypothetical protein [Mycobacterium sp.]HTH85067.1 hypothetical protein [Mycobacterium sp.]